MNIIRDVQNMSTKIWHKQFNYNVIKLAHKYFTYSFKSDHD